MYAYMTVTADSQQTWHRHTVSCLLPMTRTGDKDTWQNKRYRNLGNAWYRLAVIALPTKKIVLTPLQIMQCTSDGQIQIAIRFKSRLNHLWRFDFSKRFDLNVHDSIGIRFEIHGDSIWKSAKLQNTICLFLRNLRVSNCTFAFGFV